MLAMTDSVTMTNARTIANQVSHGVRPTTRSATPSTRTPKIVRRVWPRGDDSIHGYSRIPTSCVRSSVADGVRRTNASIDAGLDLGPPRGIVIPGSVLAAAPIRKVVRIRLNLLCHYAAMPSLHSEPVSIFACIGFHAGNELEHITRLASERLANRLERRETNRPCLSRLENRQVGERYPDFCRQLRQSHPARVENVVELHDYRHRQTVPSSSSRILVPCSKTRARTNNRSTASQRVMEKFQSRSSGCDSVETLEAIAPTAKCSSSIPSMAHAIVSSRAAFSDTNGSPTLTVSTIARSRVSTTCASGTAAMPITMISRMPRKKAEVSLPFSLTPSAVNTQVGAMRLAISSARMRNPTKMLSLINSRSTFRETASGSGYELVMDPH